MTTDQFPQAWTARIIEIAKILGALSIIASTGFGVWAWVYGPVREILDWADTMASDVAQLKQEVLSLSGANRVIMQVAGMSYIEEPVSQGQNVTMIMVAERTVLGRDCRLTDWTPIFTDRSNIPVPGQRARTGTPSQIEDGPSIRRIVMIPPAELLPGRIAVYLTLIYDCGGRTVPDRTDVVAYRLLPGNGPG